MTPRPVTRWRPSAGFALWLLMAACVLLWVVGMVAGSYVEDARRQGFACGIAFATLPTTAPTPACRDLRP